MERGQAGKRPARADCEPSLHGRGQMERKKSPAPVAFVRPFGSRATPQSANAASSPWKQGEPRVLTKSRKNEALIRNDGVYVISGIFCRANACVCGKMHSRPDRWPSEARRAEVASTRSEAQCTATEHRAAVRRERCEDKRSGRFVGKPEVCQRSETWAGHFARPTFTSPAKAKRPTR